MRFKKTIWLVPVALLVIAAAILLFGGEKPGQAEAMPETEPAAETELSAKPEKAGVPEQKTESEKTENEVFAEKTQEKSAEEKTETSAEPEESQKPAEPELSAEETSESEKLTCTVYVSCTTVLDHMDEVSEAAKSLVPSSGYLLGSVTVEFTEGETIFAILRRVLQENGIAMEYSQSVVYSSAYIEGIGGLYEFDVGELSGWMYSVNGVFPRYGCSNQTVQNGDTIAWLYTCDLGGDIGGSNF